MTTAISVRDVTKRFRIPLDRSSTLKYRVTHLRSASRYRDLLAVDGVTFDVPEGQFLGIIGRNGSGKSTLLKLLSRIYPPTKGTVVLDGLVSPFLELGVGFNPELTARENVLLNGAVLGLPRKVLEDRMEEIMHFAELEEFVDTKLKNYSSGMQVRLAFTVAIQADAGILLMDEVLAVGDARFQSKCFDVFNNYKREGRTIVLVTHDLGAVDLYCDRAILIERGKIAAEGNSTEVSGRYRHMIGDLQDADRISTGGAIVDIQDRRPGENRWGSGEVRVRSVRLLRSNGEQHVNFTSDEPMTIRIEVEALRDVDDLVVGIGLHRGDGSVVAGTNTHIARVTVPPIAAGKRLLVDYAMPRLLILSGTYRLTIAVHPMLESVTYDRLEQAFEFRVTDETGRDGTLELGGRWEVGIPRSQPAEVEMDSAERDRNIASVSEV
ncbi:MAG TPA: ABC transporter ATP-binding protein [Candidatus Dormibacteraeota bacterium]